jgi:DNA replication protein DnaC
VLLIGDSGTGKTHLLTALFVAACRQKRRVRFATATGLINELVEAQHQPAFGRALRRWARYDVLAIDESATSPSPRSAPNTCSKSLPTAPKKPQ